MAEYYYVDRAGMFGEFVRLQVAKRLFAEQDCDGDLESGFAFWASRVTVNMVPDRILYLVAIRVLPADSELVPVRAKTLLEAEFPAHS